MTLRDARKALGWTQADLEAASGVKQQHISSLENGDFQGVSYATVQKIMRAFHGAGLKGVTAEELFPLSERAS